MIILFLLITQSLALPEIDVVIPATQKDLLTLPECIRRIRKLSCNPIRRLVVISPERLVDEEWWPEYKGFPFFPNDFERSSNYQQVLKLYAHQVIQPPLLENILVLDSDVWWQSPTTFVRDDGVALYTVSEQAYDTFKYRYWMHTVLPDLKRQSFSQCGVVHHMVIQKDVVEFLLETIDNLHHRSAWKLWQADELRSEYDLYFQWAFAQYSHRVALRPLRFLDTGDITNSLTTRYDFVAFHDDLRKWKRYGYWQDHYQRYSLTPFLLPALFFGAVCGLAIFRQRKSIRIVMSLMISIILLPFLFFSVGCRYNCPRSGE